MQTALHLGTAVKHCSNSGGNHCSEFNVAIDLGLRSFIFDQTVEITSKATAL